MKRILFFLVILFAQTKLSVLKIVDSSYTPIKQLPILGPNYYPLEVGNKWVYSGYTLSEGIFGKDFISTVEVLYDTLMPNNKKYSFIKRGHGLNFDDGFERVDSFGLVYQYSPSVKGSEFVLEDLELRRFPFDDSLFIQSKARYKLFNAIDSVEYFGKTIRIIKMKEIRYMSHYEYQLGYGIGLLEVYHSFDFGYTFSKLKGAVINGVVYGDTTIVSVEEFDFPQSFSLSQNYPNPFNPATTIKYSISTPPSLPPLSKGRAGEGLVTLKAYDILGREIQTLVNEHKPPGNYEVEFKASSFGAAGLPSGVYFYRLQTENFTDTKKMVLLK